jgi:exoribonuclease R
MPARRIRVDPAAAMRDGFEAIRREVGVRVAFPAEVNDDASRAADRDPQAAERLDIPFATIDPPGSRDLDQALHIE